MTDKERGIASLESSDGKNSLLIFKCDEPGTYSIYVHISFEQYPGSTHDRDEFRDVQYRIDGGNPARLRSRCDDKCLIVTNAADVKRFAAAVASGKHLVVRAKTYQYREVDAAFDLGNAAEQIRHVVAVCKAKPII
ncbi:protein of unknown function [Burkholderia multivorans]